MINYQESSIYDDMKIMDYTILTITEYGMIVYSLYLISFQSYYERTSSLLYIKLFIQRYELYRFTILCFKVELCEKNFNSI
jgi:hypothetical protein